MCQFGEYCQNFHSRVKKIDHEVWNTFPDVFCYPTKIVLVISIMCYRFSGTSDTPTSFSTSHHSSYPAPSGGSYQLTRKKTRDHSNPISKSHYIIYLYILAWQVAILLASTLPCMHVVMWTGKVIMSSWQYLFNRITNYVTCEWENMNLSQLVVNSFPSINITCQGLQSKTHFACTVIICQQ